MNVSIRADLQDFVDEKVRSGLYSTPEDVIRAGLIALKQQESFGDFAADELQDLIAEGERSLSDSGALDAETALQARRALRNQPDELAQ